MTGPEEARAALVERLADTVMWHLQPLAESEMDRRRITDPGEVEAYHAAGSFTEGWAAVQAIRRRKVVAAALDFLAAESRLIEPGDLQGSVGVVLQVKRKVEAERDAAQAQVADLLPYAWAGADALDVWEPYGPGLVIGADPYRGEPASVMLDRIRAGEFGALP